MSSLQLNAACAALLLALSAKVVGQIFLVAGKYPAIVLIVAPGFSLKYHRSAFCAIILVVIVALAIGGGRTARHVVAGFIVASFANLVNA
jgi:hypothetical protein